MIEKPSKRATYGYLAGATLVVVMLLVIWFYA